MDPQENVTGIATDSVPEMPCSSCGVTIDLSGLQPFIPIKCPQCEAALTVPARLGSFLLLHLIGAGGMGGVYYAKDETLGRFVAIKVMLKSLGDDPQLIETFRREAQAVAKLNNPHIVQIYSFGQEKGQPYIVMELVNGRHFDRMIEEDTGLNQQLVLKIIIDIAQALQAADEIGLVHGDIKPENILLNDKMEAKLVDFGLATLTNQASADGIWGTPYYISPEKIRRKKADARSDIYSLGATLYHALAGRPPFDGETPAEVVRARLEHPPVPLSELRPDIDATVATIVMRMLEVDLSLRYPNYRSLTTDLSKALDQLGGPPDANAMRSFRMRSSKTSSIIPGSTTAAEAPSGARKGKLVIRRGTTLNAAPLSATGIDSVTRPPKTRKERRKTSRRFVRAGLVIMLLIAAAGFGVHLKEKRDRAMALRIEQFALAEARKSAAVLHTGILANVSRILASAPSVAMRFSVVTNALLVVEGHNAGLSLEPVTPPPATTNAAAQPADAAAAAMTDSAQTNLTGTAENEALPETVAAPVAPPADESDMVRLARLATDHLRDMLALHASARQSKARADQLLIEANEAQHSSHAKRKVARLGQIAEVVTAMRGALKAADEKAAATVERVKDVRVLTEKTREAERQRAEENARRQAEAARIQREQQALRLKIEQELSLTEQTWNEMLPVLKTADFEGALRAAEARLRDVETEQGKAAVQVLIDRCVYLVSGRKFLVEQLNANPYKRGWTQLGPPEDILGATPKGVTLAAGTVPWEKVSVRQILSFFVKYLSDRTLPASVRAQQNMGVAIYCHLHGGLEYAQRYADKAVELKPSLAVDARRLLPRSDGTPR